MTISELVERDRLRKENGYSTKSNLGNIAIYTVLFILFIEISERLI